MSADDLTTLPTPAPVTAFRAGMSPLAKAGIAVAIVVVLVVAAWAYGRSTMAPERAAADATRIRMMLLDARAQVLDAQLSLYAANFGNAAQHLDTRSRRWPKRRARCGTATWTSSPPGWTPRWSR